MATKERERDRYANDPEFRARKLKGSNAWYWRNREMVKARERKRKEDAKDGYYTVYYLPEEHYVGMTNNLLYRLKSHSTEYNKITDNHEVLGKFSNAVDAHWFETLFHQRGYYGFRY